MTMTKLVTKVTTATVVEARSTAMAPTQASWRVAVATATRKRLAVRASACRTQSVSAWKILDSSTSLLRPPRPPQLLPPRPPQPSNTPVSRLRRLAYWPVAAARFGIALVAFAVVGPLQIAKAAMGMRRLRTNAE